MGMATTGAIVESKCAGANGERPERILVRVIQPDVALVIGADARRVGTTSATRRDVGILCNTIVGPCLSGSGVQGCDGADKTF